MNTTNNAPRSPIAHAFFEKSGDLFANLWARWQDEREYEDFADYIARMKVAADAAGVTFVDGHKRPFGCTFKAEGWTFRLKVTGRQMSYSCIGAREVPTARTLLGGDPVELNQNDPRALAVTGGNDDYPADMLIVLYPLGGFIQKYVNGSYSVIVCNDEFVGMSLTEAEAFLAKSWPEVTTASQPLAA